ncbi:hypothetical protein BKA62DRAFT_7239 [Auriculariales sp. MPI-PUGE-AT-0066]|nr:hypothetical protein BKA62DRAFT_7239 [Auriculariales sp. MPI-PUGE-AT-0066]
MPTDTSLMAKPADNNAGLPMTPDHEYTPPVASTSTTNPPLRDYSDTQYDENGKKIPRAPNAWIIYRKDRVNEYRKEHPGQTPTQKDLSKWIGAKWAAETERVKSHYSALADQAAIEHAARYPGYKYKPEKKADKQKRLAAEKEVKAKAREVPGGVKRTARRRAGGPQVSPTPVADLTPPPLASSSSLDPKLLPGNFMLVPPLGALPSLVPESSSLLSLPQGVPFIPSAPVQTFGGGLPEFMDSYGAPDPSYFDLQAPLDVFGFDGQFDGSFGVEDFLSYQPDIAGGSDGVYQLQGVFSENDGAFLGGALDPESMDLHVALAPDFFSNITFATDAAPTFEQIIQQFSSDTTGQPQYPEIDDIASLSSPSDATTPLVTQPMPSPVSPDSSAYASPADISPAAPPSPVLHTPIQSASVTQPSYQPPRGAFLHSRKRRVGASWA